MKTALLEIGTESLPARFLLPALRQLEEKAGALMKEERLAHGGIKAYGTPMRQAVMLREVAEKSSPLTRRVTGPPARLLKDGQGGFTPQAAGFARAQGVKPENLLTVSTPKGDFLAAAATLPGEPAINILARLFPRLIEMLEFPKGLSWEESGLHYARPIRNLMALYGKRVVPFRLAGIRAGNKVRGLACLSYKPIAVADPDRYVRILRDRCVLVDVEERRAALSAALDSCAKRSGGRIDKDEALLERVVCLTEHPVPVLGHFDRAFLELPKALLLTVLKTQLNFFPILSGEGLAPDFIGVRDGISEGQKEVQEGYERVVSARLADARFFIARDRETTLEAKSEKLARVGFQRGLGSMADKTERAAALSRWICERLLQDRDVDATAVEATVRLAYADLVTGVVGEFPELQGTMGGVYARLEGLEEKVALGLEEFYYPVSAKGRLPTHIEGCIASLAGKMDTLCAMLAAGFKPSGSEDPFALRRLGNGVIRILMEKQIPLPLSGLARQALELARAKGAENPFDMEQVQRDAEDFLWQRAESLFLERGYRIDEIRSVKEGGLADLSRTFSRLAAVHSLRPDPDFGSLAQAFKRASNILRQAQYNDSSNGDIDTALLADSAEQGLFEALLRLEGEVREKVARGLFEESLRSLVSLKPQVDTFFDKVLVMAEDRNLRNNRLGLLARLVRLFRCVADISHIQN